MSQLSLALVLLGVLGAWMSHSFGQRGFGGMPEIDYSNREWQADVDFPEDTFTFVRILHRGHKGGYTDYPRADQNFTRRLQELTSIEVNPEFKQISFDDPEDLFDHPFAFMTNVDNIDDDFYEEDAEMLRKYLTNGGFIMIDDFWGDNMWEELCTVMEQVFPDKEPTPDLPLSHPIFNCVFQLDFIPQVPSHDAAENWMRLGLDNHYENSLLRRGATEDELNTPHFRAWLDDKGRIMVLACHNNDLADGWEEEKFEPWFFKKYSEKVCFPMGINIVFYALTN